MLWLNWCSIPLLELSVSSVAPALTNSDEEKALALASAAILLGLANAPARLFCWLKATEWLYCVCSLLLENIFFLFAPFDKKTSEFIEGLLAIVTVGLALVKTLVLWGPASGSLAVVLIVGWESLLFNYWFCEIVLSCRWLCDYYVWLLIVCSRGRSMSTRIRLALDSVQRVIITSSYGQIWGTRDFPVGLSASSMFLRAK